MPQFTLCPIAARRAAALVEPASALAVLDPVVRSFLDRWEDRPAGLLGAEPAMAGVTRLAPDSVLVRPADAKAPLPLFLYLAGTSEHAGLRTAALQTLAAQAGIAVLELVAPFDATPADLRAMIDDRIEATSALTGRPDRIAIGGDGLGAALALNLALHGGEYRLLVMATPVLGPPVEGRADAWMPHHRSAALTAASGTIEPARLAAGSAILPPVLMLTAEADPFRDSAEALAHTLIRQDVEVSAVRFLGTIHDFTWLPPLSDASASMEACQLIAGALRQRLHAPAWQQAG
ncbi:alpha/beta hydrolase [Sphingomonas jeddahensis]|uniref:Alpha/beta hydrolase fold protein n=1 Tax=Sphingomonas jeddahensis TaxID=1915074 RepID=A0A1V2EYS9_9SPHN|nr:alpha/beta hydrolase fold domain-containing protein [Sphingomonas jeddahensis]ONF97304.1 alpha/beta hydrolase fold protein [Sphingomonas jeddahensis]